MKLGDLALNMKVIEDVAEKIKNLSPHEINKIKLKSLAVAFLNDMAWEIMDSETIMNADLSRSERANLFLEIIAGSAAVMVIRLASKARDFNMSVSGFRCYFDHIINNSDVAELVKGEK